MRIQNKKNRRTVNIAENSNVTTNFENFHRKRAQKLYLLSPFYAHHRKISLTGFVRSKISGGTVLKFLNSVAQQCSQRPKLFLYFSCIIFRSKINIQNSNITHYRTWIFIISWRDRTILNTLTNFEDTTLKLLLETLWQKLKIIKSYFRIFTL